MAFGERGGGSSSARKRRERASRLALKTTPQPRPRRELPEQDLTRSRPRRYLPDEAPEIRRKDPDPLATEARASEARLRRTVGTQRSSRSRLGVIGESVADFGRGLLAGPSTVITGHPDPVKGFREGRRLSREYQAILQDPRSSARDKLEAAAGILVFTGAVPGGVAMGSVLRPRARTFRQGDLEVNIPPARSRTGRVLERAGDRIVRPVASRVGVMKSETEKAGLETGYKVAAEQRIRSVYAQALKKVGRKLDDGQEYTLRVLAEGASPDDRIAHHIGLAQSARQPDEVIYHGIHADLSEQTKKYVDLVQDPERGLVPALKPDAPKALHRAWELFQQSGELREELLQTIGRLSDEQIAARIHAPARVIRGARWRTYESKIQEALDASPVRREFFDAVDQQIEDEAQRNALKALFDARARNTAISVADDPQAVDEFLRYLGGVRQNVDPATLSPDALLQGQQLIDPEIVAAPIRAKLDEAIGRERDVGAGSDPLRGLRATDERDPGRLGSDVRFAEGADPDDFLAAIAANPRAAYLTAPTREELAASRIFMSEDGQAGFRLAPDGDLQNVFRNPGGQPGAGKLAVAEAIQRGATTLDAFDGFLPDLYARFGFVETGRMRFVDEYAPEGWNFARDGRPDVVFMALGAQRRALPRYFDNWDQAKGHSRLRVNEAGTLEMIRANAERWLSGRQVLPQRGGALDVASPYGIKGAIELGPEQATILLTEAADATTFIHELMHLTEVYGLMPEKPLRTLHKWAGVKKGAEPTVEQREKIARALEAVILRGEGPSPVKQAFRTLAPAFREVYEQADLPDVPAHVAQVLERLFEFKRKPGGQLFGAEDVVAGVAYAPMWRGMPVKITQPQKAMAAYIRRAGALFGGGRGRAIGAGPDDLALRKEFTGGLLLSGFFSRDVIGPRVESAMLANRMAAAHLARDKFVRAGSELPRDVSDIAVKVDPKKPVGRAARDEATETNEALNAFWDKWRHLEEGKLSVKDLDGVNFDLIEQARQDVFPAQIGGKSTAEVAAGILETGEAIDNIVWVPREFLDQSGLLYVPQSARWARSGLNKQLRKTVELSGLSWDALNDFSKALILYLNPAYIPMQLVGNVGMNLIQQGVFAPHRLWRATMLHRELEAIDRLTLDTVMGTSATGAMTMRTAPGQVLQATLGHWANLAADLIPRRAAFLHEAYRAGLKGDSLRALLKSAREGDQVAIEQLTTVADRAKRAIVDFDRMSPFEREVLSRWIFFYPWLKGATVYSIRFAADHPVQAVALALAAEYVREAQNEQLGDQPHFAELDIPISTRSAGLAVPGTDIDVGLSDLVGEHTWRDEQGNPMILRARQALAMTTPFDLVQTGLAFAGAGPKEAAAELAQSLTPVPYAAGVALYGWDPYEGHEVPPGLMTFFGQFGVTGAPISDRLEALNMSPEERAERNENAVYPRTKAHEWWRLFGGSLAPAPYNIEQGQRRALKNAPLFERRKFELIQDSREAFDAEPPPQVIEDLEWMTRLDQQIKDGQSWGERARIVAQLYDERYGGNMSGIAARVSTEGEAEQLYEQLRPHLYPYYSQWDLQVDKILDQRLEAEPAGG